MKVLRKVARIYLIQRRMLNYDIFLR